MASPKDETEIRGPEPNNPPTIAVVGGGLAGLTAAFYLARAGFKTTIFEAKDCLGGNTSSELLNGVYHDVYPHMFCPWYANFWSLFENDAKIGTQASHFSPRYGVKILDKTKGYIDLKNATSVRAIIGNLFSGLASPPDLFLLGFSMLDLAATPFDRKSSDELENLDVNGFIYSRGYSTQSVAQLQNYLLMLIWSIQSELTSASSYQDFIKHTIDYPSTTPFSFLLNGPLQTKLIDPLKRAITDLKLANGGTACDVRTGLTVQSVELIGNRMAEGKIVGGRPKISFVPTKAPPGEIAKTEQFDYMVLAAPAQQAASIVLNGPPGRRIIDAAPHLSQLQRLRSESIPVLDLYFKEGKKLVLPAEMFALCGSKESYGKHDAVTPEVADCDMTVLDLSQLWIDDPNMANRTALAVASSNRYALPAAVNNELGFLMIQHLHEYIPDFKTGTEWGDTSADIAWDKTHFRTNKTHQLFMDEVGSWNVRPDASHPAIAPFVFMAGDYCRTDVDMATMEAAVQSGVKAAQGAQAQYRLDSGRSLGEPIKMVPHEVYSDAHFLAYKLALLPYAYMASALSAQMDAGPPLEAGQLPQNAYSPKTYSILLPLAFALDWWKTAYWLTRRLIEPTLSGESGPEGLKAVADIPRRFLVGELQALGAPRSPEGVFQPGERLGQALQQFTDQLWRTARSALPATPTAPNDDPRRLQRKKS